MKTVPLLCLCLLSALPLTAPAAPRAVLPQGSEIAFRVTQMGVDVSGRFTRFDARIDWVDDDPSRSSAEVTVDIGSLSTGDDEADAVALDKPWLNRAAFPQAQFRSTSVRRLDATRYEASGTLTIRGRTRPLSFGFSLRPRDGGGALLEGEFAVLRSDFGIGGGEWNEGDLVADRVPVRVRLLLAPP
ncbi:YceI family protein [Fontimonas sp. SYSU GA230001]|uniref:YceI family protein n=1 Tax=Fontimonas sp. SYSU GA230001 TaxID=3142450 RepID=UPI0032B4D35A